jgi:RNA polymerase sigma factor (sigma-70 family)
VASVGRQDADDVFQETFLAAMRAYPRLRPDSNLQAWVLTIAHRKALDHHRARARRPVPGEVPEVAVTDAEPTDDELWNQVRALPPKQRGAVALRYAADLGYEAIGQALGTSADAARRNVHEGIKKLRQEAGEAGRSRTAGGRPSTSRRGAGGPAEVTPA